MNHDKEWELTVTLIALVLLACLCEMMGVLYHGN